MPPESTTRVVWDHIAEAAAVVFNRWMYQPELAWAKKAWEILSTAKLTIFANEFERYQVLLRLLVLGGIYSDFCDVAWEEYSEPNYCDWAESLQFDPLLLGQLYTRLPELEPMNQQSASEALDQLVETERSAVVAALFEGFGGASGLYAALWRSNAVKRADDEQC